jgi:hypothetical protein
VHGVPVSRGDTSEHPLLGAASAVAAHGEVYSNAVQPRRWTVEPANLLPVAADADQCLLGDFLGEVAITNQ